MDGDEDGFVSIFDGKTLDGWEGDPKYWRAADGVMTGEVTAETLLKSNTFLIWRGGAPEDFELKVEYRITAGGNSGVNYRSVVVPDTVTPANRFAMAGYQCDIDGQNRYTGQYYEQATGRGIIAWRGQVVRTEEGKSPRLLATLGDKDELGGYVKIDDWNQLHIIARGNTMTHIVNGHVMSVLIDDDPTKFRKSGIIGFEIEGTGKINIRNIWLKKL